MKKRRRTAKSPLAAGFTTSLPPHELSTLLEVSSALAASLDLGQVLQKAIESAVRVLGLDTGAIYLIDGMTLYMGATTPPLPPEFPEELRLADLINHPHIRESVEVGQPVYLSDVRTASLSPAEKAVVEVRGLRSILYIPLFLEEQPTGVLIVGSTHELRAFTDHELELARTLSYQIALAVANARLFRSVQHANEELRRAYDATLEGWSRALEMRDENTEGHTRRVTELALALARKMHLPISSLEHIRRGALLHDIGKMGIPDSILHNPESLTEEEQAIMRKHPEMAYDFLKQIDYLRPALDIPYYHHEKWDGSGYPQGLKGTDIPLAARIFSVVDVFDALVSDRFYKRGSSREEALAYIHEQAGKHFDPEVAAAFIQLVQGEAKPAGK
jgi:putative nucleotidyltransferase with HDIG domain